MNIKIKEIKLDKVKYEKGKNILAVSLSKVDLPEGEIHCSMKPFKLSAADLTDKGWVWCNLKPVLHNRFYDILNDKLDKFYYFLLETCEPHPLQIAKKYFLAKQDYEAAHYIREYIKKEQDDIFEEDTFYSITLNIPDANWRKL